MTPISLRVCDEAASVLAHQIMAVSLLSVSRWRCVGLRWEWVGKFDKVSVSLIACSWIRSLRVFFQFSLMADRPAASTAPHSLPRSPAHYHRGWLVDHQFQSLLSGFCYLIFTFHFGVTGVPVPDCPRHRFVSSDSNRSMTFYDFTQIYPKVPVSLWALLQIKEQDRWMTAFDF